MSVSAIQKVL